ncbi:unnamed protein product [Effrenium voratum]|nr:unnamed protein product [Effrenium voratum]|mmetsp:Transcript_136621/g.323656  ORF Transcript_136621/g.323656 Transcript_136621/m.323656 type:complete len:496 (-) Transcript_136621:145-1632(-)|eukprot:CAMPEP_0181447680 /NCGR_PEP_ID=MMETSP1110-20121109/26746_1 /TAXON_ID=174948 /ORGANISM="Symbiodinium sp., Strain CCMP421" /LENGTH=495 /DNA_ID=CAMNT_0023571799 /DNA_START=95 /DNA_END=1582 /DNA_ORIENTATION=-
MEVIREYVAVVKVYAFPVAGVLLVLYPAALMAWTVIEGSAAGSAKEQELEQKDLKRGAEKELQKPQKAKREGLSWSHASRCFKRRSSYLGIGTVIALSFLISRRFLSSCFVSVPTKPPAPQMGQESSSSSASASFFPDSMPMAAFSAVSTLSIAAGLALRRSSFARRPSWTLGRRGVNFTERSATFTKSVDVNGYGFFDRQLSGPWTAPEAPAVLQEPDQDLDGEVSLWHDVSLYVKSWLDEPTALLHYVNEMPMGTLRKFEVQPGAPGNVIEEDVKGSKKLAKFGKPVPFNYGCFPQTYRDPDKADDMYNAPGDDDPLDVIDLADVTTKVGAIVRCRVLGAVCLIDEGQADWKVLVVNVDSKSALADAHSIEDVERISPGRVQTVWSWMEELKSAGKAKLHREIHDAQCALQLIAEDHSSWKDLVDSAGPDGTARGHWICAPHETAKAQVLKLGWAPPCVVPGQQVRSPCMLAGAARVSVLARAARAVQLARTQ